MKFPPTNLTELLREKLAGPDESAGIGLVSNYAEPGAVETSASALELALEAWTLVLGSEGVVCDPEMLRRASTATLPTRAGVPAILRPVNRNDVQECVRVANRFGVPIYPVSSGKNWGYGSGAPVQTAVLLDLAGLNRIVDFNEDLAYVTIEPGVTQRQLYQFLQSRHSRLWMDATGSSPDCSIIGNTVERGFGHTPMGDHCGNACGFEVVLPTGECVETGFCSFPGAKTGAISRWGVGPSLEGLFSQSNLGIVTRMSVWLMPAPEYFQAFYFSCRDEQSFALVIDALRPLRLNQTIRSVVHIGNDYKVLSGTRQYPWTETNGETPLQGQTLERVRTTLNIGRWNGSGGLCGTRSQVRAARRQVRRALRGKAEHLRFVDDRVMRLLRRFAKPYGLITGWDVSRVLTLMTPVYNLMKGVPTDAMLPSTHWRKTAEPPSHVDPDRDGCGLIWCSPVAPNTGADATIVTRLAERALLSHGFEPIITVSLSTERTLTCVISISYDRSVAGEDERAMACYRTLSGELLAHGYPPYRLNVCSMNDLDHQSESANLVRSLKAALDPRGILAPGRYEPPPLTSSDAAPVADHGTVSKGRGPDRN